MSELKHLEENFRVKLYNLGLDNGFLDIPVSKRKTDKLNIKIKNFYTLNDTIKEVKRWPIEWDKIFASQISNKSFIPEYMKNSHKSIRKRKITL